MNFFLENLFTQETNTTLIPQRARSVQRIIGGKFTDIKDVPYTVALLQRNQFFCGGSIVSTSHVVTAAHCLSSYVFLD